MVGQAIVTAVQIYVIAIVIVIATLVAVLIKVMVSLTVRLEQRAVANAVPQGKVCPGFLGIPDEDVAALSAAISAVIGTYHISHNSGPSHAWSSLGRFARHTSHAEHLRSKH